LVANFAEVLEINFLLRERDFDLFSAEFFFDLVSGAAFRSWAMGLIGKRGSERHYLTWMPTAN
jgi:hypothetical protein